ncbi:C-C motif chemokine 8-like isoform X2 [Hyla sarda]|uniref:C-C motif chemokine 8-like isoform X2 n=1 Tax=Hyla sarda TaxID=327740 RepID=UPI0024C453E7|nr:C-C motif chemokine 8-like isoform X2 [Hyla sarda]
MAPLVPSEPGLGLDHKETHTCFEVQAKRVDLKILQSYSMKTFPIHAILFSTKDGIKICVDPNESWAKRAITVLDKRGQNQSPDGTERDGSKKEVKKPTKKPKKPAGKKTQRKPKKQTKPSKKAAPVKSIMTILTTRTPAVKP